MKSTFRMFLTGSLAFVLIGCFQGTWAMGADPVDKVLQLGRGLYRGLVPFSSPARLGQFSLPSTSMVCSNCHGLRGEGKREGGIEAPSVQWRNLLTAHGGQPAFASEDAITQAIVQSKGRQQQPLLPPMPQFVLSAEERSALLAYLRVIGTERDPVQGVQVESISIGSVLPLSGPRAEIGRAIQLALESRLDMVNRNGGIFGRKIVLQVADAGNDPESALQAVRELMDKGVFVLLGSMVPANYNELVALARSKSVPLVANLGLPLNDSSDAYLTYLLPGLVTQARHLLNEMPRYCDSGVPGILILHAPDIRLSNLAQQVRAGSAAENTQLRAVEDAEQIRQALESQPVGTVIGLLPPSLAAILREQWAGRVSTGQCLGTMAALSGNPRDSTNVPALQAILSEHRNHAEIIVLPMPPFVQTEQDAPLTEVQLWRILGDTGAQLFVEAIARSGYVLDTDGFIQAMNTLHSYETSSGLKVTFSDKQFHGLNVAYLWRINDHELAKR